MRGSGPPSEPAEVVLELLPGMSPFVRAEVARTLPEATTVTAGDTEVRLRSVAPRRTLGLRTVVAAYLAVPLPVARPRSMLSPERLKVLADAAATAVRTAHPARFHGIRIGAAGSDSADFQRLRRRLAEATGLLDDEDGDLLVRVRRTTDGWEGLVRLTPRPLSARPWRVARHDAAANATVAAAVVDATEPAPDDEVVDLTCGSGTIVLERLARGAAQRVVAVDVDADALDRLRENQRAARFRGRVELVHADARSLSPAGMRFTTLVANLPWGERSGSHADNDVLYPQLLAAARQLARDGARGAFLTHDIRRFDRALAVVGGWDVEATWRIFQKGHRPCLYLLRPGPAS